MLEELRSEAAKVQGAATPKSPGVSEVAASLEGNSPRFADTFYGGGVTSDLPMPESAGYNNSGFLPTNSFMADLTSWGQFDSLVTAGIGMLDGGDAGFGFGLGM